MARCRWTSSAVAACVLLSGALAAAEDTGPIYGPPAPRDVQTLNLVDPIDGQAFQWELPLSSNALGGYDSDGCTYARGEQARSSGVATSPTTLYSARAEAFARPLTPEQKESLLEMLSAAGADVDDARQLSPAARYSLAAAVGQQLGDPPFDLAELYLVGAWTVRDTIVGFLPGVRGAGDAWNKLQQVIALAETVTDDGARTRALFDLARLAHRGGFVHERDDFLNKLDSFPDAGLGAQEKREEFRRRVIQENAMLTQALRLYREGLQARGADPADGAVARLMVADLSRRLGDFAEARDQAESVRLDPAAPPEVVVQAQDVLQALKTQAQKPFPAKEPAP
jgi:hypothetical protein